MEWETSTVQTFCWMNFLSHYWTFHRGAKSNFRETFMSTIEVNSVTLVNKSLILSSEENQTFLFQLSKWIEVFLLTKFDIILFFSLQNLGAFSVHMVSLAAMFDGVWSSLLLIILSTGLESLQLSIKHWLCKLMMLLKLFNQNPSRKFPLNY